MLCPLSTYLQYITLPNYKFCVFWNDFLSTFDPSSPCSFHYNYMSMLFMLTITSPLIKTYIISPSGCTFIGVCENAILFWFFTSVVDTEVGVITHVLCHEEESWKSCIAQLRTIIAKFLPDALSWGFHIHIQEWLQIKIAIFFFRSLIVWISIAVYSYKLW